MFRIRYLICLLILTLTLGSCYLGYNLYKGYGGKVISEDEQTKTPIGNEDKDFNKYVDFEMYDEQLRNSLYNSEEAYEKYIQDTYQTEENYKVQVIKQILIANYGFSDEDAAEEFALNLVERVKENDK